MFLLCCSCLMRCLLGCQEPLQKLLLLSFCIFHLHLLRPRLQSVGKVSNILALSETLSPSLPLSLAICTSIFTCALAIIRFMLSQAQLHVMLYLPLQKCLPACDCPHCLSRVSTQFASLGFSADPTSAHSQLLLLLPMFTQWDVLMSHDSIVCRLMHKSRDSQ